MIYHTPTLTKTTRQEIHDKLLKKNQLDLWWQLFFAGFFPITEWPSPLPMEPTKEPPYYWNPLIHGTWTGYEL